MTKDILILGGARTPMGKYGGALRDLSAIELGAIAAREAIKRSNISPEAIDHTVIGNALQTSGDAIYGARRVALKAGVPIDKPALTVNRLCGSGIQSIVSGAQSRSWFRVRGSGFVVQSSGFVVQSSWFRVQPLGCFVVTQGRGKLKLEL